MRWRRLGRVTSIWKCLDRCEPVDGLIVNEQEVLGERTVCLLLRCGIYEYVQPFDGSIFTEASLSCYCSLILLSIMSVS